MKTEMTKYDEQANKFLKTHNIKFRATLADSKPCPWAMAEKPFKAESHHYRVTLSGKSQINHNGSRRLVFDFWGSIADAEKGQKTVTAYDVLACVSSDINCPDTFADFCSEYGYEADSIKSLQAFRRCDRFGKRLREFFTTAEIEALSEIQ